MTATRALRTLLNAGGMIRAPGVYDGITGKLAEQAGFPCLYMTGAGTSMSRGYPDFGLLTLTEMAANASMIARTVGIPLIADADTGYGNELNVTRTVCEYERGGVAGLHIEDQVMPKRCGHLDGKELVSREEFVAKIRAAVAARTDPDFVVIARTDSRAGEGLDEAVARVNAALDAGADVAFVEAAASMEEVAAIPRLVHGPCLLNIVVAGRDARHRAGRGRGHGLPARHHAEPFAEHRDERLRRRAAGGADHRPAAVERRAATGGRPVPPLQRRRLGRAAHPVPQSARDQGRRRVAAGQAIGRTSSASRRTSPSRLNHSTVTKITIPGNSVTWSATPR